MSIKMQNVKIKDRGRISHILRLFPKEKFAAKSAGFTVLMGELIPEGAGKRKKILYIIAESLANSAEIMGKINGAK